MKRMKRVRKESDLRYSRFTSFITFSHQQQDNNLSLPSLDFLSTKNPVLRHFSRLETSLSLSSYFFFSLSYFFFSLSHLFIRVFECVRMKKEGNEEKRKVSSTASLTLPSFRFISCFSLFSWPWIVLDCMKCFQEE